MYYLTSPVDADLIAARLALVSTAISDYQLKNLARGDIRLDPDPSSELETRDFKCLRPRLGRRQGLPRRDRAIA
jgi:hypothetical protein